MPADKDSPPEPGSRQKKTSPAILGEGGRSGGAEDSHGILYHYTRTTPSHCLSEGKQCVPRGILDKLVAHSGIAAHIVKNEPSRGPARANKSQQAGPTSVERRRGAKGAAPVGHPKTSQEPAKADAAAEDGAAAESDAAAEGTLKAESEGTAEDEGTITVPMEDLLKSTGCGTEACVVKKILPKREAETVLRTYFKPQGPRDTTELLSNEHIDEILEVWAGRYPDFFCCPFSMMDFEHRPSEFARVNLASVYRGRAPQWVREEGRSRRAYRPCRTFACVLNTDVSTGRGKHWVAVFADMRSREASEPWTVEYFNSAGNPPSPQVTRWMERAAEELRALRNGEGPPGPVHTVPVTRVTHQRSRTECGPYTLFYVRSRLEATPYKAFATGGRISDEKMEAFRAHLFRSD